jgi:hypothetical protein
VAVTGNNGTLDWGELPRWWALHGSAALAFGRPHTLLFARSKRVEVCAAMVKVYSVTFFNSKLIH